MLGCGSICGTSPLEGSGQQFQYYFSLLQQKIYNIICFKQLWNNEIINKLFITKWYYLNMILLQFWNILFSYKMCVTEKKTYSVDRQWRLESIHTLRIESIYTLLLSWSIPLNGYGSTQF